MTAAGRSQISRGVALAAGAAALFGATTPLLKQAGAGVGILAAGALLYLGAAAGAAVVSLVRRGGAAPVWLPRARLVAVAVLGAVAAPALLIAGLRRTDAATGSLLLTLEAPFTLVLARLVLREYLGRRVLVAATLIVAGGALLGAGHANAPSAIAGVVLVVGATGAWALDNLVSRTLADADPVRLVMAKGTLGGALSLAVALATREPLPSLPAAVALLAIGALGFGASLQLYLRAQTLVGAARTASVFAAAPFVGAAVALLAGGPWPGWPFAAAATAMLAGVALHVSERHAHPHTHDALEHEHPHTHDDGHHLHAHDPAVIGPHSHRHRHDPLTHDHEHSEDLHHRHPH